MTDLVVVKRRGALHPADDLSEEVLSTIPEGRAFKAKISQPRSLPWLRRYWALVGVIARNSSYDRQDVHALLKLRAGCVRVIQERSGNIVRVPDSIAFDKMTQDEFVIFWRKVVDYTAAELLPGIDSKLLEREIIGLVGLPLEFAK